MRVNAVIPLGFPKFCFFLDDVPTTRNLFHCSTLPRGSIWPFRTGRLSEHSGMAIQCWRLQGCSPEELWGQSRHYAASGSTLPKNIGC